MKTPDSLIRDQLGSSIVESLLAFGLVAGAAVAVFPIFAKVKQDTKFSDSKQLCENVVRGKLDEYRFGRVVDVVAASTPQPALGYLSMPTRSGTSVNGGVPLASGGFLYSKLRYNQLFNSGVCNGTSLATGKQYGARECIGSTTAWREIPTSPGGGGASPGGGGYPYPTPSASPAPCASPIADVNVQGSIPGFKLYVKLELATPWQLKPPGSSTSEFSNTCPMQSSPDGQLYDFGGAGDAIKVTVTGVMDVGSAGMQKLGDVAWDDWGRMTCSASATIAPERYPVRYFLSKGGRIYNVYGNGWNGSTNSGFVFPSIYTQGGGMSASGIIAFAVHPRDLSVYVLRRGMITRYGNCQGVPVDCDLATPDSLSDDGDDNTRPVIQNFKVNASISSIGVDFRTGKVYGFRRDDHGITADPERDVLELSVSGANAANCTNLLPGNLCAFKHYKLASGTASETPIPLGTFPKYSAIARAGRIQGLFINPEGDEAYVSDLTSSVTLGGRSYSSSIYRITETTLTQPLATLAVDAAMFSK